MLVDQMKLLAKQVSDIKERVYFSHEIYEAKMQFEPVVGQKYYLYEKKGGDKFLSMISPLEWNNPNQKFMCEVVLLADRTWQVLSRAKQD